MSAATNLAAMFPPKNKQIWSSTINWQPIPIHTIPRSLDIILNPYKPCDAYDHYYEQLLKSEQFVQMQNKYQYLYDYLTIHSGQNVSNLEMVRSLHDTLSIERLYKKR